MSPKEVVGSFRSRRTTESAIMSMCHAKAMPCCVRVCVRWRDAEKRRTVGLDIYKCCFGEQHLFPMGTHPNCLFGIRTCSHPQICSHPCLENISKRGWPVAVGSCSLYGSTATLCPVRWCVQRCYRGSRVWSYLFTCFTVGRESAALGWKNIKKGGDSYHAHARCRWEWHHFPITWSG